MSTSRPFAYNTGLTLPFTIQVGNIAVGDGDVRYDQDYGGLKWWNGPDEDLGYVVAHTTPSGNQPNPLNVPAYIGFWRSVNKTDNSFIELTNTLFNQTFTNGNDCRTYLNNNGYWTSYIFVPTPTPTPTNTPTSTPTNTPTPTPTSTISPTPTPTSTSGITFSQAFTGGTAPSSAIETAWNVFRAGLTGSYTTFTISSTNGSSVTVTDPTLVQTLANALRNATNNTSVTIGGVVWRVGTGCGTPKIGGVAVEFSNIASCSGSSTIALRPMLNNLNWGGIGTGSTVGQASQTITLTFS